MISKSLNLRVLAPMSRFAFIIVAWLVSEGSSNSSAVAGIGSAVEVGEWISKTYELADVASAGEVGFDYRSLA